MGAVVNKRSAAKANVQWMQNLINGGKIPTVPVGKLYIDEPIRFPAKNPCGRIRTSGGAGYPMDYHGQISGPISEIVQITPGQPCFIVGGAGLYSEEPLYLTHEQAAAEAEPASAIEIEGRDPPATGRHRFGNILVRRWESLGKALNGFYEKVGSDWVFQEDENHADNTVWHDCETFECDRLFWSKNQQAVNHVFRDCRVNGLGPERDFVAFDIERGGCVKFPGLIVEQSQFTLIRVTDYSPNNCDFEGSVFFDRFLNPDTNLCVFEYAGNPAYANFSKWILDIRIFSALQLNPIENHVLYRVPVDMPRDYWNVEFRNIPQN